MTSTNQVFPVVWQDDHVWLIDQTRLPEEYDIVQISRSDDMAEAIRTMIVQSAPAIGVAVAYGMYLGAREIATPDRDQFLVELEQVGLMFKATRPTAINLFWAVDRMLKTARQTIGPVEYLQEMLLKTAQLMSAEDLRTCQAIGDYGLQVLPTDPTQLRVLTHGNAGALATAGYGTALGVVRSAWREGRLARVYVDETRPRFQGAKLTAWECVQEGIPVTIITDSMAAHCMQRGMVDVVVVGAERIAANGDTANKIGTYNLALIANVHRIPFLVAAPLSTVDFGLTDGSQIPIEEQDASEICCIGDARICPSAVEFYNPAFDVTPADLVTAIVTEQGVVKPGELMPLQEKQVV